MKKNKLIIIALLLVPFLVFGFENPIDVGSFPELIDRIIDFIRDLAFVIAPIIFIFAGIKYYFSGGSPEEAKKATDMMKWAVVGLAIIIIAGGITSIITDIMGVEVEEDGTTTVSYNLESN